MNVRMRSDGQRKAEEVGLLRNFERMDHYADMYLTVRITLTQSVAFVVQLGESLVITLEWPAGNGDFRT